MALSQLEASNSLLKVPSPHIKKGTLESKDLRQNQATLFNLLNLSKKENEIDLYQNRKNQ